MSYCRQTLSGGDANHDLRFHTGIRVLMRTGALTFGCIANDDNGNGIDDAVDIADGPSRAVKANGTPAGAQQSNGQGRP